MRANPWQAQLTRMFRRRPALVLTSLLAVAAPGRAGQILDLRIDCGGDFAPGDVVPFTLSLENRSDQAVRLDAQVTLAVPGAGSLELLSGRFTLAAGDQYFNAGRSVALPEAAPLGEYALTFAATTAQESSFDTCTFRVQ